MYQKNLTLIKKVINIYRNKYKQINKTMTVQERYDKAINAYLKAFEKQTETELEFRIGLDGAMFADYSLDFTTIKYIVDHKKSFEELVRWYDFIMVFHEKCNPTFMVYNKLEQDYNNLNVYYSQNEFILYTLLNK